jgi:hypothetical protein
MAAMSGAEMRKLEKQIKRNRKQILESEKDRQRASKRGFKTQKDGWKYLLNQIANMFEDGEFPTP